MVMCSGVATTIGAGWSGTTPFGLSLVISSTCGAALYQIGVGRKHRELGLSSPQLIYQQSRLSGALLLPAILWMDHWQSWFDLSFSAFCTLLSTGLVASVVNLSQFLVIDSTSALTFNVASQLKTCAVIVIAWIFTNKSPTAIDYLGLVLTISGSTCYGYISLQERQRNNVAVTEKGGRV